MVGAIAAVVGVVLAATTLDAASVVWAKGLAPGPHAFFQVMTRFGKSEWWLVPSGVGFLILLCGNWQRVAPSVARAWAELGAVTAFFFFAVAGAGLTTDLIKLAVGRSRPALVGPGGSLALDPFKSGYLHLSFPSGHTTTVAAATAVLALIMPRVAIPVGILGLVVMVSRVAVGAHFPSDVVGGCFVGAAFTVALAMGWSRARVAFSRTPDGRLKAETGAIRWTMRRGGVGALAKGLARALTPSRN